MAVQHEVKTECGKTVHVKGKDVSFYRSLKEWVDDHSNEIQIALSVFGIAKGYRVKSVTRKPKS